MARQMRSTAAWHWGRSPAAQARAASGARPPGSLRSALAATASGAAVAAAVVAAAVVAVLELVLVVVHARRGGQARERQLELDLCAEERRRHGDARGERDGHHLRAERDGHRSGADGGNGAFELDLGLVAYLAVVAQRDCARGVDDADEPAV